MGLLDGVLGGVVGAVVTDVIRRNGGVQGVVNQFETKGFGPRVLDLDIILFDDLVVDDSKLTIPHPRMHKRRFVLKPICDIDPDITHPVLQQTMISLLENLDEKGQGITEYK